jgi:acyl-coenzyme A thioesterase PaaI-like protein
VSDPDAATAPEAAGATAPGAAEYAFDRATAVRPRPGGAVHDIEVDGDWTIGGRPNGGYLLALLARAAVSSAAGVEGLAHPHPLTASAHYLSAPSPGPAEVRAEVLRRGRRMSQVRSRLLQGGSARVEAVFTLGRLDPASEPWWDDVPVPPDATPEARCVRRAPSAGDFPVAIMDQVDLRLDPAVSGFARGEPTGRGEVRGFVRFADGRPPDPLGLLLAVDILPPATFELGTVGWVPTFELTAYVRRVPAPGALLVRHRARLVEADIVDEVCDVWDSRGRLVAQATQLAGVRVGDTRPAPRH